MTIPELLWVVTLGVAVMLAAVDMFVGWMDSDVTWQRVIWAIVLQWIALFSQVLIMALVLEGKG